MASVTLAESAKLSRNLLVPGIIEDIITVNDMFQLLPFDAISGNALQFTREATVGDVQVGGVDTSITAKTAATFTSVTASLTTIIGDAEINSLIQATRSNETDQVDTQVGSKAKGVGRKYQDMLINGTGSSNQFTGLLALCSAGQTLEGGTNGASMTLDILDQLLDLVTDKDGEVEWMAMHRALKRKYFAILRALGGNSATDVITLPSGKEVPAYRGTPILANDWIPTTQTQGSSSVCTTVLAGNFDDGSRTIGIAGLTAEQDAGINLVYVGIDPAKDNEIWRIRFHCGLAQYSDKGLAMVKGLLLT
jgi:HK97 family phage major capsid protein